MVCQPYNDFTSSNREQVNNISSPFSHAANYLPIAANPTMVPAVPKTAYQQYSLFGESTNKNLIGEKSFSEVKNIQTLEQCLEAENVIDDRHMTEVSDTSHNQELAGYLLPCGK